MMNTTKLEKAIKDINIKLNLISKVPTMLSEEQAAEILGYTKSTIQKKIYQKEIPNDWYTVNAVGKRFYFLDKIYGLAV